MSTPPVFIRKPSKRGKKGSAWWPVLATRCPSQKYQRAGSEVFQHAASHGRDATSRVAAWGGPCNHVHIRVVVVINLEGRLSRERRHMRLHARRRLREPRWMATGSPQLHSCRRKSSSARKSTETPRIRHMPTAFPMKLTRWRVPPLPHHASNVGVVAARCTLHALCKGKQNPQ